MKRMPSAFVLVLLVACSGQPTEDAAPGGDTEVSATIRFQVSGEAEEVAVYDAVIKAFENVNPNVQVEMTAIAEKDEHLAKLATSFAAGKAPDVFLVNFREYSQFVAQGALEPVDGLLEDAGIDYADYFPQPIEAFTYDEQLQCMPQNISSLVVYYNKTLFKEAGLKHPDADWTWSDFRSYGDALTEGDVDGMGIEPSVIRMAPFVWGNGGEIVDDPDNPTRFAFEEPAAREALEFIVSLVEDGLVPTEEEVTAQDLETRFMAGKLGMLLSSRRETPSFREVVGLDFDVASLPVGEEPAGILYSDGYCISAGSENVDAAVAFIAFATGSEGQTLTSLAGRTVPSLKSVANSPAFLDPTQPPKHSAVFIDAIPNIERTPVLPTWPEIEDVTEEILTRVFYEDGYSIDQGIEELEEQTHVLFEEGTSG